MHRLFDFQNSKFRIKLNQTLSQRIVLQIVILTQRITINGKNVLISMQTCTNNVFNNIHVIKDLQESVNAQIVKCA